MLLMHVMPRLAGQHMLALWERRLSMILLLNTATLASATTCMHLALPFTVQTCTAAIRRYQALAWHALLWLGSLLSTCSTPSLLLHMTSHTLCTDHTHEAIPTMESTTDQHL